VEEWRKKNGVEDGIDGGAGRDSEKRGVETESGEREKGVKRRREE